MAANVTAVVVSYRSADVIGPCLASLVAESDIKRVIVIDNSACQHTRNIVATHPQSKYIASTTNLGFGKAVNRARPHVDTPYVAVVNPDTVTQAGTIGACTRFLQRGSRRGLMSPTVVTAGHIYRTSEREVTLLRLVSTAVNRFPQLQLQRPASDHTSAHEAIALNGAYLVARVQALDDAGWFDESVFLFGEEHSLAARLRACDWQVWYAPVGAVFHRDGHSTDQVPKALIDLLLRQARYRQLLTTRGRLEAYTYLFLSRLLRLNMLPKRLWPSRRPARR